MMYILNLGYSIMRFSCQSCFLFIFFLLQDCLVKISSSLRANIYMHVLNDIKIGVLSLLLLDQLIALPI